jgi:hypothetical protein
MRVIHAQFDSRDFTTPGVTATQNLLRNGGASDGTTYSNIDIGGWDGVVMLYHDAGGDGNSNMYTQHNAQAFANAIPYLQGLGYAFVTVEELLRIKGATPATGGSGAQFNGHFGNRNWQAWDSGVVLARFPTCAPGTVCMNTRCP